MQPGDARILVGNREWCALPELGIPAIKARVDSGAKTSSLHAFNLETFERDGQTWVRFEVHPVQKSQRISIWVEAPVIDRRRVRSSHRDIEQRCVIRSLLRLGGAEWPVEITLTNRDSMGYRMLLGRQAMRTRLMIDPDAAYLTGKTDAQAMAKLYDQPAPKPRKRRTASVLPPDAQRG